MARGLTKAFSDQYGNVYPSAYFVIHALHTDYVEQTSYITVSIYKDQAAFTAKKRPVDTFVYDVQPTAYKRADGFTIPAFIAAFPANIQAGYALDVNAFVTWLQTTPELAGGV